MDLWRFQNVRIEIIAPLHGAFDRPVLWLTRAAIEFCLLGISLVDLRAEATVLSRSTTQITPSKVAGGLNMLFTTVFIYQMVQVEHHYGMRFGS